MKKKIICILILVILFVSIFSIKKYSLVIEHTQNLKTNEPITFTIKSLYYGKEKEFDAINVNIINKHNTNEKFITTINQYKKGEYKFIFTPNIPGYYYVNIEGKKDGQSIVEKKTLLVQ